MHCLMQASDMQNPKEACIALPMNLVFNAVLDMLQVVATFKGVSFPQGQRLINKTTPGEPCGPVPDCFVKVVELAFQDTHGAGN